MEREPLHFVPVLAKEQIEETALLASVIWHEYFVSILSDGQIDYMVQKFQSAEAVQQQLQEGYQYFQIRLSDGRLAGYFGIRADREPDSKLFLSKLYIKKEFRRKGLARQAMDFLYELCEKQGFGRISLTCNKYNEGSLSCYKKLGFHQTDSIVTEIGNGYVMDDYVMERVVGSC